MLRVIAVAVYYFLGAAAAVMHLGVSAVGGGVGTLRSVGGTVERVRLGSGGHAVSVAHGGGS